MAGEHLNTNSWRTALCSLLCALSFSAVLPSTSHAASANVAGLLGGCGSKPAWIENATMPPEGQSSFVSCFSNDLGQAEVALSITNNRPYAQLITVSGAQLDLVDSSFASSLDGRLAWLLASSRSQEALSEESPSAFLLGPRRRVTLQIDRPAPGAAQVVRIGPAPANPFAVADLAWKLLSGARNLSLPVATQACIAAVVDEGLSSPPQPEFALSQMHSCVDASGLRRNALRRLRGLAARLLRNGPFRKIVHLEGAERHRARIVYTVSASNPYLTNPEIKLGPANLGTLPAGRRTTRHLTASGGTPPYRFYIVSEPGGPGIPSWVTLAANGTLSVEPPSGGLDVNLTVEVVDSKGEHSVIPF